MNDESVMIKLEHIETLLTQFIGETGNNGRFGKLEDIVMEHEAYINSQKGATGFGRYVWDLVLIMIAGFVGYFSKGK